MKIKLLPEQRKQVEEIRTSSNRLVELTNLLTTLADPKGESYIYRKEAVVPETLIREAVAPYLKLFAKKGVRVSFQIANDLPRVFLDPSKMRFALRTLLENALAYTNSGDAVTVSADTAGRSIVVSVKDTGIGLSQQDMSQIFTRFFRSTAAKHADTEGLGIGLFMAKTVVERHGGKIYVSSEGEGRGSCFTIRLPLAR